MKKNYELQGMSCGGCVSSIKNALLDHPDVEEAEICLNPQMAVLTVKEEVASPGKQVQYHLSVLPMILIIKHQRYRCCF